MTKPYKILFLIGAIYSIALTYIVVTNRILIISNKQKIESIAPVVDSNADRSKDSQKKVDSLLEIINKAVDAD